MEREKSMSPRLFRFWLVIAVLSVAASPAFGQEFRGSIAGRVTDTSKARLPGATTTLTLGVVASSRAYATSTVEGATPGL